MSNRHEQLRPIARRLGIVEPVFANICVHKHMNRFTLRTKSKVDVQWTRTRFALVHNIGKIHAFWALAQLGINGLFECLQTEKTAPISTSLAPDIWENFFFDSRVMWQQGDMI